MPKFVKECLTKESDYYINLKTLVLYTNKTLVFYMPAETVTPKETLIKNALSSCSFNHQDSYTDSGDFPLGWVEINGAGVKSLKELIPERQDSLDISGLDCSQGLIEQAKSRLQYLNERFKETSAQLAKHPENHDLANYLYRGVQRPRLACQQLLEKYERGGKGEIFLSPEVEEKNGIRRPKKGSKTIILQKPNP